MKKIQALAITTLLLLTFNCVSAQYGNGNGYGNGYGNGSGRNNQMSQMNQTPSKPKEIPAEVTVGKIMEGLKKELELDQLQEIAISNVLIESMRDQGMLMKSESNQEQKAKEFQALSETTNRKVNEFLNEDQKVKYKDFIAKGPSDRKKSDKKKSRKRE